MREEDARDAAVVLPRIWVGLEESVGQLPSRGDRNRGQRGGPDHVANGVHSVGRRVLIPVHLDEPAVVECDTSSVEPDVGQRVPSYRHDDLVGIVEGDGLAVPSVLQRELSIARSVDALQGGLVHKGDAIGLGLSLDQGPQRLVKVGQDLFAPEHEGDIGPQTVQDAGQLDPDVSRAHHHCFLREVFEFKEAVAGDGVLDARDVRHDGGPPGCDADVRGRVRAAVVGTAGAGHGDLSITRQLCPPRDDVDPGLGQILIVDSVESVDVRITRSLDFRPREGLDRGVKPVARSVLQVLPHVCSVPHDLLGNTANIHTGATQPTTLNHSSLESKLGGTSGKREATTPRPEHQDVVRFRHRWLECERTGAVRAISI
eukprot:m.216590 g.216590  ORF g.216590 m.216590 type:complete len:372 (+) comp25655_c0_seq1:3661-4776(+)